MVLGSTTLYQSMPHLRSAKKLDKIIHQLTNLREVWERIGPSSCIQALNVAADGLDDVVDELSPGSAPAPGFTRNERKLMGLALGAIAAGGFFLAGVHYERHNSFAPNVARVGP